MIMYMFQTYSCKIEVTFQFTYYFNNDFYHSIIQQTQSLIYYLAFYSNMLILPVI